MGGHIDNVDAVAQSAYCMLQTRRYEHLIFSNQYGSELYTLIGKDKDYVFVEACRIIKETLLTDNRILDVFNFGIDEDSDIITFDITTIYGKNTLSIGGVYSV